MWNNNFIKCFSFLFQRQEIPVEVLKTIYQYTLDAIGKNGIKGEMGTSRKAMKQLTQWITKYTEEHSLKIKCENLEKEKSYRRKNKELFKPSWMCHSSLLSEERTLCFNYKNE